MVSKESGVSGDSGSPVLDGRFRDSIESGFFLNRFLFTNIHADRPEGFIKALNSVHGSPLSMNKGYVDLMKQYRTAGIPMVRLPVGDGSDYSLSGVFPDSRKDPDDPAAYRFTDIDLAMESIRLSGAIPLWEATYDIGSTDHRFQHCFQQGSAPADPEKWAQVVQYVLRHFNDGWANGHHWNVEYVEFLNEPFKSNLYDRKDYQSCWQVYELLSRAIEGYNQETGHDVKLLGYSNPMNLSSGSAMDYTNDLWLMDSFLSFVQERDLKLDIFSFHLYGDYLEQVQAAKLVREHLDKGGFSGVPIWNTEWNTRVISSEDKMLSSAYFAAHNVQTKTVWQGLVDRAFVFRASQRSIRAGDPTEVDQQCDDTYYIAADGTPLPAYYTWFMFREMEENTPNRLLTEPVDKDMVTFLAGRSDDGERINLLVSYWVGNTSDVPDKEYSAAIEGLSPGQVWTAELRVVDRYTTDYAPVDVVELQTDQLGRLVVARLVEPWSVHFWTLLGPDNGI